MRKLIFFHPADSRDVSACLRALGRANWRILPTTNAADARALLAQHDIALGLVLLDGDTLPAPELESLLLENQQLEWIALVTNHTLRQPDLRALIGHLCHDYHTLPVDRERLLQALGHAHGKVTLRRQLAPQPDGDRFHQLIGESPSMRQLFSILQRTSDTDVPILLTGESGTGKELAARTIHQLSGRTRGVFMAVNCAAIPAHLIQSELFGHEKGAFTGAIQRKIGRLEAAAGGTVFLDEIGDLPIDHQAHLLRFLQDKIVTRLGATTGNCVDVRVICATNIDLEKAMAEGRFREDLYYRINVLRIKMPPLRERDNDIQLLAQAYFEKFSVESRTRTARGFSQQALCAMRAHPWPGNIRELTNRIRCATIMSKNRLLTAADLGLEKYLHGQELDQATTLDGVRNGAECELIKNVLRRNGNNMSRTARQLGISRATLYRKMSKLARGDGDGAPATLKME